MNWPGNLHWTPKRHARWSFFRAGICLAFAVTFSVAGQYEGQRTVAYERTIIMAKGNGDQGQQGEPSKQDRADQYRRDQQQEKDNPGGGNGGKKS